MKELVIMEAPALTKLADLNASVPQVLLAPDAKVMSTNAYPVLVKNTEPKIAYSWSMIIVATAKLVLWEDIVKQK